MQQKSLTIKSYWFALLSVQLFNASLCFGKKESLSLDSSKQFFHDKSIEEFQDMQSSSRKLEESLKSNPAYALEKKEIFKLSLAGSGSFIFNGFLGLENESSGSPEASFDQFNYKDDFAFGGRLGFDSVLKKKFFLFSRFDINAISPLSTAEDTAVNFYGFLGLGGRFATIGKKKNHYIGASVSFLSLFSSSPYLQTLDPEIGYFKPGIALGFNFTGERNRVSSYKMDVLLLTGSLVSIGFNVNYEEIFRISQNIDFYTFFSLYGAFSLEDITSFDYDNDYAYVTPILGAGFRIGL